MAFLAAAVFGLVVIIRMLVLKGASADAQNFRREDQPLAYWSIVVAAGLIDLALFVLAYRDLTH